MTRLNLLLVVLLCLTALPAFSQQKSVMAGTPAVDSIPEYHALYVLNHDNDKAIRGLLRNVQNALNDPRLKGKLHIEIIAFGDGVALYLKTNHYDSLMTPLKAQGVSFVQCLNTIEERNIAKSALYDFVRYVPSGNGEIILRQYEGWAIVHP